MSHKIATFADVIAQGANEAAKKKQPFHYAQLANALIGAKRISFDQNVESIIEKSNALPFEEILGQLDRIRLPFRTLWIEQATDNLEALTPPGTGRIRLGFFVRSEKDCGAFSFHSYQSTAFLNGINPTFGVDTKKFIEHLGRVSRRPEAQAEFPSVLFIGNRMIYQSTSSLITVSQQNGIQFEDEKLLADIEAAASRLHERSKHKPENLINSLYDQAERLARIFTILGSSFADESKFLAKTIPDQEAESYDRLRIKKDRVALVPVTPIVINLSARAHAVLNRAEPKEIRNLLGWTSVRRTHVVNKYGTEFWRKPHDRRIAADVDRRDVERKLTNSKDALRLELQGGQSVRVIVQPGDH